MLHARLPSLIRVYSLEKLIEAEGMGLVCVQFGHQTLRQIFHTKQLQKNTKFRLIDLFGSYFVKAKGHFSCAQNGAQFGCLLLRQLKWLYNKPT